MKKRVGILYGKPIIVGDKNDQTVNEIYLSSGESIGNNNGGSENNNEVLKIELIESQFLINGISFRVDPYTNQGTYVISVASKKIYKHVIENNIKSAILTIIEETGIDKAELNSVSYVHVYETGEDVEGLVQFMFIHFGYPGLWKVEITNYD